jgi:hypothetical protein
LEVGLKDIVDLFDSVDISREERKAKLKENIEQAYESKIRYENADISYRVKKKKKLPNMGHWKWQFRND